MDTEKAIVELNVGGKAFMTTLGTLRSDQNSMLAKMFPSEANERLNRDANGVPFIDRCPKYFGVILNFMRSGKLEKGPNIDLEFLRNEATHFGIVGKMNITKYIKNLLLGPFISI